jgi:putative ABC transport system substrate-binding protein
MLLSRHTRRRAFIAALGGAAAWPLVARAQQVAKLPTIGFLGATRSSAWVPYTTSFLSGLNEAGFVEGQNVLIEYRWAEGRYDRLPKLAVELAQRKVVIIFASGGQPATRAAMAATTTIPIIFISADNPVERGLVSSLNHPASNVTGVNFLSMEATAKRVALLREVLPKAATLALLVNPDGPASLAEQQKVQLAEGTFGKQITGLVANNALAIDAAFATLVEKRADGLIVSVDAYFLMQRAQIIALSAKHAVPAIYPEREFVTAGGLMSYGTPLREAYRQAGLYAGQMLKGAKLVELPVIQATTFELVINLNTARALGLEIPPSLLARSDEVIE